MEISYMCKDTFLCTLFLMTLKASFCDRCFLNVTDKSVLLFLITFNISFGYPSEAFILTVPVFVYCFQAVSFSTYPIHATPVES